jgi:uncharacterized protein (DUF1499 family)
MYWLWPTLAVLLSVASVAIAIVALYVDDWRRDLTSNSASTSDDPRASLASPHSDLPPAELANHVVSVAGNLPRWRLAKLEEGSGVVTIRFIRATPLFRFKDDITVRVTPDGTGSILHAESKSRLGTADFGQNPRNLRELLDALG